jgi:ATP adenylyltransferase
MDYLWSPWRYRYVSLAGAGGDAPAGCLFCRKAAEADDKQNYILLRAERNFVLLNLYPYTSGHLMIAPYAHVPVLEQSDPATLEEMMRLARRAEVALRAVCKPDGFNVGINIGQSAGAGVPGHLHMHVVPRWTGDSSFMTTVGETRVLPEDLDTTWEKLSAAMQGHAETGG